MIRYINSAGQKIACQSYSGQGVGVFYIGGHKTVMSGGLKCEPIRDFCIERNVPFVAFDYAGWGLSGDDRREWQVDQWAENVIDVLDQVVDSPSILIGNSMGGYIMLLAALVRPRKVKGLLGLAPGFGSYIQVTGRNEIAYIPENISIRLKLESDPVDHHLINQDLDIHCPIHCIHTMADTLVPWHSSVNICQVMATDNIRIELIKDGDHSLSRPSDIAMILKSLETFKDCCEERMVP